ncbi:MAG: transcriptional regulator, partial [Hyphomicrobiaceae bacterium]
MQYQFHDFLLDLDTYELRRGEKLVHVEPLVFDLLRFCIANAGRVLSRDEIIAEVWRGRFVSDAAVSSAIKAARKALGDSGETQTYIRTIRGRGFQFTVEALSVAPPDAEVSAHSNEQAQNPEDEPDKAKSTLASPPRIAVLPLFPLTMDDELRLLGDAISQEV